MNASYPVVAIILNLIGVNAWCIPAITIKGYIPATSPKAINPNLSCIKYITEDKTSPNIDPKGPTTTITIGAVNNTTNIGFKKFLVIVGVILSTNFSM